MSKIKAIPPHRFNAGHALISRKWPKTVLSQQAIPRTGLEKALGAVAAEFKRAKELYPREFNSAHEGYAIILEEIDELRVEVWKKQSKRSKVKMRKECVQIAAMAIQFAMELT